MTRRTFNWNETTEKYKKEEKRDFVRNDGYSENLFIPKLDEKGQYQAVIRFLPRPEEDGNGVPFVKLYNHGFKGVAGWFIENCPTTHKDPCPVCKANGEIWDEDENLARKRGRRTSYFSNILIISDRQNKENEGKIFIFRYGKTIHDMIMEKISPEEGYEDDTIHVHDYDEGLNFKLKIKPKKTGSVKYNDYSSSQFADTVTPIAKTDKEINAIDGSLYKLEQILSSDKFKSFDTLQAKFLSVIGEASIPKNNDSNDSDDDSDDSQSDDQSEDDSKDLETESTGAEAPDAFFKKLNK